MRAEIAKAGLHVQAVAGTLHLSTARFEDYFESWLAGHKPFIDPGTWNDYRTHGIKRLIPSSAQALDEMAPADVREWLARASQQGIYKPKTLNNAHRDCGSRGRASRRHDGFAAALSAVEGSCERDELLII